MGRGPRCDECSENLEQCTECEAWFCPTCQANADGEHVCNDSGIDDDWDDEDAAFLDDDEEGYDDDDDDEEGYDDDDDDDL